jgi:hypothetical protein
MCRPMTHVKHKITPSFEELISKAAKEQLDDKLEKAEISRLRHLNMKSNRLNDKFNVSKLRSNVKSIFRNSLPSSPFSGES